MLTGLEIEALKRRFQSNTLYDRQVLRQRHHFTEPTGAIGPVSDASKKDDHMTGEGSLEEDDASLWHARRVAAPCVQSVSIRGGYRYAFGHKKLRVSR